MKHQKWCENFMKEVCPHWIKNQIEPESTVCDACKVAFEAGKDYANITMTRYNEYIEKIRIAEKYNKGLYEANKLLKKSIIDLDKCRKKIEPVVKKITQNKKTMI